MSRCIGCGVKLQTIDEKIAGYVPEISLIEKGEDVYCKRCFDIRHHNIKYNVENNLEDYYAKIKVIKDEKALVVLLIDVMDIMGGFIPNLVKYIGDNKVLLIVNKIDVIPKSMKLTKLENFVRIVAKESKLNIESIMFGSAKSEEFVKKVVAKITKLKYPSKNTNNYKKKEVDRFGNCYVVGHSSVGKSTFMNMLGKMYLHFEKDVITTSSQFQTTIDFIKWPLDSKSFIIDTPGIVNPHNFFAYLSSKSVDVLTPKRYIKPKTFQLNPDQTIFLGGLVRLDFKGKEKTNVSFFVSNDLYIHRTKTINANNVYDTQITKLLIPPFDEAELSNLSCKKTISYDIKSKTTIFISGIGFINVVSLDGVLDITLPKMINVGRLDDEFE